MKICFFGSYRKNYSRNILTKKALKELGHQVIIINSSKKGIRQYFDLINNFQKKNAEIDVIFLPVLAHYHVPLAWFLSVIFRKKLIADTFFSLYDTYVLDRATTKAGTIYSLRLKMYDLLTAKLPDKIIFDTQENANYFAKKYYVSKKKISILPVTFDPDIFRPKKRKSISTKTVGFYGSFLPLHGTKKILEAAKEMKTDKIKFLILGSGHEGDEVKKTINNDKNLSKKVQLVQDFVPYEKLPDFYSKIDLFLGGPFGDTPKAKRVLPAKVVESLSMGVPTIVVKTTATYRLLKDYKGKNLIWLTNNEVKSLSILIKNSLNFKDDERLNNSSNFRISSLSYDSFNLKLNLIVNNV